jgi:hypothetical protein
MRAALVVFALLGGLLVGVAKLTEDMEVAILTTYQEGITYHTRLWVLDDGVTLWIRAGGTNRRWYRRLVGDPIVELDRDELIRGYRAEPDPDPRIVARVNHLMREKYGLADGIFCAIHMWSEVMPIRLLPR